MITQSYVKRLIDKGYDWKEISLQVGAATMINGLFVVTNSEDANEVSEIMEREKYNRRAKNRVLSLDKIAQSIEEHGERNTALGGYFLMKSGYVIEGKTWEESKESLKKMFYGGKK